MKLLLRILLFFLCITSAPQSWSQDTHKPPTLPPLETSARPEILEKNYVHFEVAEESSFTLSILKAYNNIARYLPLKREYSMLNWKVYSRPDSELLVDNYSRKDHFGRWINDPDDQTCFNTRAKVLERDSRRRLIFKDNNHCIVDSGLWSDPYTNKNLRIAKEVQIDHMVPLKNAYMSGAHSWNFQSRCLYANYMGQKNHLLPVDANENMRKGDRSPKDYMPPNSRITCTYIKNWLSIKFLWGLKMTVSEAQSVLNIIKENNCDTQQFKMSYSEIMKQHQYARENIDLCSHLEAASRP